jgi:hypothetical protein
MPQFLVILFIHGEVGITDERKRGISQHWPVRLLG